MSREQSQAAAHAAANQEMSTRHPDAGHTKSQQWLADSEYRSEYRRIYERDLAARERMSCDPDDARDVEQVVTCGWFSEPALCW